MILPLPGTPHLTYCTNIHPGESWEEVRTNVERGVVRVKERISRDCLFGVGLRLSALAAEELSKPDRLEEFTRSLEEWGLYVFTINGFPYGKFHGTRVKEKVYLPDWLDDRRLEYTNRLALLLAALLPSSDKVPQLTGTISTVPGAFRARIAGESDCPIIADRLLRHLSVLRDIRERTGRSITLALEPEPCCLLETVADTVDFFERHLFSPAALSRLGAMIGASRADSEPFLRRHLGVCLDACHMAVEFEDPEEAVQAFQTAGIAIAKIQLSVGLRFFMGSESSAMPEALQPFRDGVYLHQVVEHRDGALIRYGDLPEALQRYRPATEPVEWRMHLHVPLFREQLGLFGTTQAFLRRLLALIAGKPISPHLEVETYTWSVLPAKFRNDDIVSSVARELEWVLEQCGCRCSK